LGSGVFEGLGSPRQSFRPLTIAVTRHSATTAQETQRVFLEGKRRRFFVAYPRSLDGAVLLGEEAVEPQDKPGSIMSDVVTRWFEIWAQEKRLAA
jgi:predicted solute-binding protein